MVLAGLLARPILRGLVKVGFMLFTSGLTYFGGHLSQQSAPTYRVTAWPSAAETAGQFSGVNISSASPASVVSGASGLFQEEESAVDVMVGLSLFFTIGGPRPLCRFLPGNSPRAGGHVKIGAGRLGSDGHRGAGPNLLSGGYSSGERSYQRPPSISSRPAGLRTRDQVK